MIGICTFQSKSQKTRLFETAMNLSFSICKQPQPLINFHGGLNTGSLNFNSHKDKVVIVIGATGTGKSRLSIDLATHFPAEIVNSDKIQVYRGLDIVTNKVTEDECRGVPHHLLGIIDPNADFTTTDFRHHASLAIESIIERDRLPIIAGGSNSFVDSLVNDDPYFAARCECCFLWVDVSLPILESFVSDRVDQMVKAGLVDEVRAIFDPKADYARGIRRAIGVPELDQFLRMERNADPATLDALLQDAVEAIKVNTYKLACRQLQKIHRLRDVWGWPLHHVDATEAFLKHGQEANEAWERLVVSPSAVIVGQFLYEDFNDVISDPTGTTVLSRAVPSMVAMATATH
ncbi:hypothetical protein Cgig2_023002 [Carnegiea gigantea]|uniref:adenylate dimethylallyltransferase (ADP/ATP-dependent) n=1 Tax=Carnegiea gigantea TaxID=171969 RepID=A0A9Q1JJ89_9CARY|nr:hypothetical protein Cgig2_008616 [Carnegiea gigantea]KAJ8439840.1 hypothetical protein Cgig2_023002 [Carnegiea gigantea]